MPTPPDPVLATMTGRSPLASAASRLLDVLLAGVALILFAPILAVIIVAIVLETGRPIFFAQVRLGRGGRHFRIYKFRKFDDRNQTRTSGCPLTLDDDPRMTRVGRILARTKLDELPQFWNVLRGDMAIVGPRPESLAFAECFTGPYKRVLDHKPGIFGPSQVLFRNESALYNGRSDPAQFYCEWVFPQKAELDLGYFPRRTILGDILWIARGVFAVFGCSPTRQPGANLGRAPEYSRHNGGDRALATGLELHARLETAPDRG